MQSIKYLLESLIMQMISRRENIALFSWSVGEKFSSFLFVNFKSMLTKLALSNNALLN